jgi:class 3 adenylate cyclase
LAAALARLAAPSAFVRPLVLKAGAHAGPRIAVTVNGRHDYFGSTVNIAARIEGLSSGSDVIPSNTVGLDPEVDAMLTAPGLLVEPLETTLKGFGEERFALRRVCRSG